MALKIDILANTRQLQQEMKKAGASVEDITDALDDVQDESTKLEGSFRDLARQGTKAGDDINRGTRKAEGGMKDLKQEANSTARESAASFDGSAESIGDTFQELAANVFQGFGPAGAVAGLAVAAGIGVGVSAVTAMGEEAEAQKEVVKAAFQEMADNGIASWSSLEEQNRRLSEAYAEHEGEIQRIADLAGLNFETVAAAWAGNTEAIDQVNSAYAQMESDLRTTMGVSYEASQATIRGWEGVKKPLDDTLASYDKAKEKAKQYADQVNAEQQRVQDKAAETSAMISKGFTIPVKADFTQFDQAVRAQMNKSRTITINGSYGRNLMG